MTDKEKLEKIVAYLMRRMYAHNQKADIGSTGEIFDEKIENAKYEECRDTLNFIDSMQENPINEAFAKTVGYLVQDVVANEKDAANYANYKRKPTSYFVEKYQSVFGNLIKKAWHRSNEEPKDNSKVIVCQVDDKTQTVLTMEYHSSDKYFHLLSPLGNDYTVSLNYPKVRWAYPEDLLPIK